MKIEVSNGEIADKYSVLLVKEMKIKDENKLLNVRNERHSIKPTLDLFMKTTDKLFVDLFNINFKLWEVLDLQDSLIQKSQHDHEFIELTLKVHELNDLRYQVKREINEVTQSSLFEEKEYERD